MKSAIRNCAGMAYALMLLASTSSTAQKTFSLSPQETQQINQYVRNYQIYPVSQTATENNPSAYVLADKPIDPNQLSGNFVTLPDPYVQIRKEVKGVFVKNELTTDLKGQYNMGFTKSYPVIKDIDSQQHYFIISEDYLPTVDVIIERRALWKTLHQKGYQEYERGGEMYIKTKTAEIKLDTWTFSEFKANPAYLETFDNDQIKIAALVKQTPAHTKILEKYVNLYNVKRRNMASGELNAWRTATANAQKLQNQIYKISKKYEGNYSYKLLNPSDSHDVFVTNLRASKGVLGM